MIKIMVDSGSDSRMDSGLCDFHIPLTVSIGGKDYLDGQNLTADRFYELLTATEEFPKTSQPSPEMFLESFEKAKEAADEVLCFTISSALSGTYQSAVIAKEMADYDGIYVINTRMVSHLIGILTAYAKKRILDGATAAQIAEECEELKTRVKVLAGVDTLEYLYKGGRLSRAGAAVGQVAGIKPVVMFTPEGAVTVAGKAIGVNRAMQFILNKLKQARIDPAFPVYSLYTCGTAHTEKLENSLQELGITVADRRQVGPTIGAHVGPNVYGVVFVVK